jgi:hypothetical protein
MNKLEWQSACVVRECHWNDHIWVGGAVVGHESGRYRVVTPDGVDHPGRGDSPEQVVSEISRFYE